MRVFVKSEAPHNMQRAASELALIHIEQMLKSVRTSLLQGLVDD